MLNIHNISVSYNKIQAIRNVSLEVNEGEIVTLMGPNGAGKTTTLNAICGVVPYSGTIKYHGENLNKLKTDQIVKKGIMMVPEGRRVFPNLSVANNLLMGAYTRKINKKQLNQELEEIYSLFPRLAERKNQMGGTMSGGEQQMLAIGRALMSKPKLLILDEPSMGLAPLVVKNIFETIKKINENGLTILLVEQNARMALSVADRGYLLENGEIHYHDTVENLLSRDLVQKSYLGG